MPKRTSRDFNQIAKAVVDAVAQGTEKNPAAVALGRLGGLKGGPARARKLSAKKRADIAKRAARVRWGR